MAEVLNYEVIDYKLDSLVHETEKGAILYFIHGSVFYQETDIY